MHTVIKKLTRFLVLGLLFFLPKEKKIRIDRWLRGKEEFRKLRLADCVIVSFGKSGRTWMRVMLSRFYQVKHDLPRRHLLEFDNLNRKNPAIPRVLFSHNNYLRDYLRDWTTLEHFRGKKVVLLSFNRHVGGMTSGGLTATDLGRKESIGGLALEFYNRIGRKSGFRPSEAESLYLQMLNEEGVDVLLGRALKSVDMNSNRVLSICMESGETILRAE